MLSKFSFLSFFSYSIPSFFHIQFWCNLYKFVIIEREIWILRNFQVIPSNPSSSLLRSPSHQPAYLQFQTSVTTLELFLRAVSIFLWLIEERAIHILTKKKRMGCCCAPAVFVGPVVWAQLSSNPCSDFISSSRQSRSHRCKTNLKHKPRLLVLNSASPNRIK